MSERNLAYNFMPGLRKNSQLLHIAAEKQIFKYKFRQNNVKYYNCYQEKCPVSVAVQVNNPSTCRKTKIHQTHNHGSQEELIKKMILVNSIKNNWANASLKRTHLREVFAEECKRFKDSSGLVRFEKMKRQLHNIRKETIMNNNKKSSGSFIKTELTQHSSNNTCFEDTCNEKDDNVPEEISIELDPIYLNEETNDSNSSFFKSQNLQTKVLEEFSSFNSNLKHKPKELSFCENLAIQLQDADLPTEVFTNFKQAVYTAFIHAVQEKQVNKL